MKIKILGLITFGLVTIFLSCSSDRFPYGKRLYLKHCSDCHMDDGSGVAKLYPSLIEESLLDTYLDIPCQIRYGSQDSTSLIKMLGIPNLTEVEITNIVNYLIQDLNKGTDELLVRQTKLALNNCNMIK